MDVGVVTSALKGYFGIRGHEGQMLLLEDSVLSSMDSTHRLRSDQLRMM